MKYEVLLRTRKQTGRCLTTSLPPSCQGLWPQDMVGEVTPDMDKDREDREDRRTGRTGRTGRIGTGRTSDDCRPAPDKHSEP